MGLRYAVLGGLMSLALAAPAFAGDLTSIELDPSGKAIAVKKDPAKLAAIPDSTKQELGGIPMKGFTYGAVHTVAPNSIDISKGINVMRGHVDAGGSIVVHEGPNQIYVLYVISGTGKMTLNDKEGKEYGDITYKPDDVILFNPHTWHGWVNGDKPFEFFGFDMQAPAK
jgi:quercetin dioxygenase-like cupin family protein